MYIFILLWRNQQLFLAFSDVFKLQILVFTVNIFVHVWMLWLERPTIAWPRFDTCRTCPYMTFQHPTYTYRIHFRFECVVIRIQSTHSWFWRFICTQTTHFRFRCFLLVCFYVLCMYLCSMHVEAALLRIKLLRQENELKHLRLQLSQLSRGHASAFNAETKDTNKVPEGASSDSEASDDSESSESGVVLGKFLQGLSRKVYKHPTNDECSSSSTQRSPGNCGVTSGFRSSSSPSGYCSSSIKRSTGISGATSGTTDPCSSGAPCSSCCSNNLKQVDLNRVDINPAFQTIARQFTQNIRKQARSEALQDSPSASTRQLQTARVLDFNVCLQVAHARANTRRKHAKWIM